MGDKPKRTCGKPNCWGYGPEAVIAMEEAEPSVEKYSGHGHIENLDDIWAYERKTRKGTD